MYANETEEFDTESNISGDSDLDFSLASVLGDLQTYVGYLTKLTISLEHPAPDPVEATTTPVPATNLNLQRSSNQKTGDQIFFGSGSEKTLGKGRTVDDTNPRSILPDLGDSGRVLGKRPFRNSIEQEISDSAKSVNLSSREDVLHRSRRSKRGFLSERKDNDFSEMHNTDVPIPSNISSGISSTVQSADSGSRSGYQPDYSSYPSPYSQLSHPLSYLSNNSPSYLSSHPSSYQSSYQSSHESGGKPVTIEQTGVPAPSRAIHTRFVSGARVNCPIVGCAHAGFSRLDKFYQHIKSVQHREVIKDCRGNSWVKDSGGGLLEVRWTS